MIRDRVLWAILALVLASMAVSLWEQALVAGIAASALALQSAIAAVRGRCFGALGTMLPTFGAKDGNARR